MGDCPKCHRPLQKCQKCDGRGGISDFGNWTNCGNCKTTGKVCNEHGGNWK
jgi:hypothetical protein